MPDEQPERRMPQLSTQSAEELVPCLGTVVRVQPLDRFRLRILEEGPEQVFNDEVLRISDVTLFQHPILVLTDKEVRDMLLKLQLGWFSFRHKIACISSWPSLPAAGLSRIRESTTCGRW